MLRLNYSGLKTMQIYLTDMIRVLACLRPPNQVHKESGAFITCLYKKYTNPARAILDFCQQMLWPLPYSQLMHHGAKFKGTTGTDV